MFKNGRYGNQPTYLSGKMMLLWVLLIQATSACFITDCPHGMGKRSEGLTLHQGPRKYPQCPTCGPAHLQTGPDAFRCFGPNLCCSPGKGCLSGNLPGVRMCAYEDLKPTPCENHAKHCSTVGQGGQCVYKGICCNPHGVCSKDEECSKHNISNLDLKLLAIEQMLDQEEEDVNY